MIKYLRNSENTMKNLKKNNNQNKKKITLYGKIIMMFLGLLPKYVSYILP
jgi:hypothetical protein